MPNFTTAYTPSGIQTTTSAPPSSPVSGLDPHLQDVANQIINMKLDAAKRRQAEEIASAGRASQARLEATPGTDAYARAGSRQFLAQGGNPRPQTGAIMGGGGLGTIQQQMQQVALQDAMQQVAAKGRRAPTRTVSGPNIISGETVDPLQMNGYDRAAHLPDNATGGRLF
jgi:hypothetical protein